LIVLGYPKHYFFIRKSEVMSTMDSVVKNAKEQGKEQLKLGSNATQSTINTLIAILAAYAAKDPEAKSLKQRLEDLKKS
jgi:hypothetical protein